MKEGAPGVSEVISYGTRCTGITFSASARAPLYRTDTTCGEGIGCRPASFIKLAPTLDKR
jgi:hypothetical protein